MTVQEFLNTTTFNQDDLIHIVHPTGLSLTLEGNDFECGDALGQAQIIHHHTKNECDRTYHRINVA